MSSKYLHIVAFDIPDPPNYGGVIVIYYHLKALFEAGVKVILHAYEYDNREPTPILEQFCYQTYYYPRNKKIIDQFSTLPFIVKSRSDNRLLQKLKQDEHPIFFEGHHTCFFLGHSDLKHRQKIVRVHNIETNYYQNLADLEGNPVKKLYFQLESQKLKRFDTYLTQHANKIIALAPDDWQFYQKKHSNCVYVAPFHPDEKISIKEGKGDYILFHGKLSVKDNEKAALFLINKIAPKIAFKIVLAGLNPSAALLQAAQQHPNVKLLPNVSHQKMEDLVKNAHIHFLWTFQKAGMKLKLLKALFRGRHCIANPIMVDNTGLENLCHICQNPNQIIQKINELIPIPFDVQHELEKRKTILEKQFSNKKNIKKTIEIIWDK